MSVLSRALRHAWCFDRKALQPLKARQSLTQGLDTRFAEILMTQNLSAMRIITATE